MPDIRGVVTDEEPCPYLPDRKWRNFLIERAGPVSPVRHEFYLDRGFRRMGRLIYRPSCDSCQECRSLRIDVKSYRPSKSHRRARNRNRDLVVSIDRTSYSDEKRDLLERYLDVRHDGPMSADEIPVRDYMFFDTGSSFEICYRQDGRLVALGLVDLTPSILSSVYFYYDPDLAERSLGIYSMLVEIELARGQGRTWYHPGYYVEGCAAMTYKARFGPAEILDRDRGWVSFSPPDRPASRASTRG
ncbi:MAG: arginyltransferase [Planctomycetes bacterium]|nr:arginyltransferase [Planctomycetota bacterium]